MKASVFMISSGHKNSKQNLQNGQLPQLLSIFYTCHNEYFPEKFVWPHLKITKLIQDVMFYNISNIVGRHKQISVRAIDLLLFAGFCTINCTFRFDQQQLVISKDDTWHQRCRKTVDSFTVRFQPLKNIPLQISAKSLNLNKVQRYSML